MPRTIRQLSVAAGAVLVVLAIGPTARPTTPRLTGAVENLRGAPLAGVTVSLGGQTQVTDASGRFHFETPPEGATDLNASRVAYAPATATWPTSEEGWLTITMSPRIVRALHVSGTTAADDAEWATMLAIADATAINGMMIDVKTESGFVFAANDVNTVEAMGADAPNQYILAERVAEARAADLAVIVRIVSFQDPIAAQARPDWAAWDTATGGPYEKSGQYFLDPHDSDAQQYALDLGIMACEAGVDEVQFDYMRFPSGDPDTVIYDGANTPEARQDVIAGFLTRARAELEPLGCATAVDIFGFITNKTHEGGIGQQLELLTDAVDVISPMTYPSLYSVGWYGFTDPSQRPGPVVRQANQDALDRMQGTAAVLRPWLQDFSYTEGQVHVQLVEADALGLGWMLWNVTSTFTVPAILGEHEVTAHEVVPAPVFTERPASGFYDVDDDHRFASAIGWAADEAITLGCNPPYGDLFCTDERVTRAQMAAFLARALGLEGTAAEEGSGAFTDDDGSVFEGDIEAIAAAGITVGCDAERFCPDDAVSRAQMATFLARALGLEPHDQPARFLDDDGSIHEPAIAAIAEEGITLGCAPLAFCPTEPVSRGQMAAFLYRALAEPS